MKLFKKILIFSLYFFIFFAPNFCNPETSKPPAAPPLPPPQPATEIGRTPKSQITLTQKSDLLEAIRKGTSLKKTPQKKSRELKPEEEEKKKEPTSYQKTPGGTIGGAGFFAKEKRGVDPTENPLFQKQKECAQKLEVEAKKTEEQKKEEAAKMQQDQILQNQKSFDNNLQKLNKAIKSVEFGDAITNLNIALGKDFNNLGNQLKPENITKLQKYVKEKFKSENKEFIELLQRYHLKKESDIDEEITKKEKEKQELESKKKSTSQEEEKKAFIAQISRLTEEINSIKGQKDKTIDKLLRQLEWKEEDRNNLIKALEERLQEKPKVQQKKKLKVGEEQQKKEQEELAKILAERKRKSEKKPSEKKPKSKKKRRPTRTTTQQQKQQQKQQLFTNYLKKFEKDWDETKINQHLESNNKFLSKELKKLKTENLWLEKHPSEQIETLKTFINAPETLSNNYYKAIEKNPLLTFTQKLIIPKNATVYSHGDFHGNFRDLKSIIQRYIAQKTLFFNKDGNLKVKKNSYLIFTGDYVDRGPQSLELILFLLELKFNNPDQVFLLRGNHETYSTFSLYGFITEVNKKLNENKNAVKLKNQIFLSFETMPTALFVGCKEVEPTQYIIFCHGAIDPNYNPVGLLESKNTLQSISKNVFQNIVWSDVIEKKEKEILSSGRGDGKAYTTGYIKNYLEENSSDKNKIILLVRAHEHGQPAEKNKEIYEKIGAAFFGDIAITTMSGTIYYPKKDGYTGYCIDYNTYDSTSDYDPTYLKLIPQQEDATWDITINYNERKEEKGKKTANWKSKEIDFKDVIKPKLTKEMLEEKEKKERELKEEEERERKLEDEIKKIKNHVNDDAKKGSWNTIFLPLFNAVKKGDLEATKLILEKTEDDEFKTKLKEGMDQAEININPNEENDKNQTALHYILAGGDLNNKNVFKCVYFLISGEEYLEIPPMPEEEMKIQTEIPDLPKELPTQTKIPDISDLGTPPPLLPETLEKETEKLKIPKPLPEPPLPSDVPFDPIQAFGPPPPL